MKRIFHVVVFILCSFSLFSQSEYSKTIDVFLIGGQSNATGQGYMKNIPKKFEVDTSVILYYSKYLNNGKNSEQWLPLCQASETEDKFGIELSMGTLLQKKYPSRKIALIKHALSGSNLYEQWNPGNRNGEKQGKEYEKLIKTVKDGLDKLRTKGYSPILRAMVWQQGENDAYYTTDIENSYAYGTNLNNLIWQVRKDLDAVNMLFIYGSVIPFPLPQLFPGRDIVRKAQRNIDESTKNILSVDGAVLVNADDLQMRSTDYNTPLPNDSVHLGTYGILELGERFGQTIINRTNND